MAAGTVGNTAFTEVSPLDDPAFAQLFQQIMASIPQGQPGIQDLVSQGANSPLIQAILGPALERLRIPQAQQRQQFTESARSAGGLRGSTYSSGLTNLMQNQGLQQNDLMSQVISQVLNTLVSGQLQSQQQQFLPAQTMGNVLPRIAPQTLQGGLPSGGGAGMFGGGGGRSSILQPGQDYGNYAAGNAILTPGIGLPFNQGGGQPQQQQQGPAPTQAPPQYIDPWAWVPQQGGGTGSGGTFDIGGGMQYYQPQDQFGFTATDWAADPFYSGGGEWY